MSPLGPWKINLGLCSGDYGPRGVDLGPWGVDLYTGGVDFGPWGLDLGTCGVESGPWCVDLGPWGVDSGPWGVALCPRGVDLGPLGVDLGTWALGALFITYLYDILVLVLWITPEMQKSDADWLCVGAFGMRCSACDRLLVGACVGLCVRVCVCVCACAFSLSCFDATGRSCVPTFSTESTGLRNATNSSPHMSQSENIHQQKTQQKYQECANACPRRVSHERCPVP